jgi:hypothetical protein
MIGTLVSETSSVALNAKPKVTEVEQFSVDTIPDADRTSKPFDLFRIQFGGANTFATVLFRHFSDFLRSIVLAGPSSNRFGFAGGNPLFDADGHFWP